MFFLEVDLIVEIGEMLIPFEVKYQSQITQIRDVPGLVDLCVQKPSIKHGFIITKMPQDIGVLHNQLMRIPTALFCYWLGAAEFQQKNILI